MVGYYQYDDTKQCSGTPYSGAAYSLSSYGNCHFGKKISCTNNGLIVTQYTGTQYTGSDCTGNSTSFLNLKPSACINGRKAFCAGDFNVPPNYLANIEYNGFQCGEQIVTISFTILDICITTGIQSQILHYVSGNNEIVTYQYTNSSTCEKDAPFTSTYTKLDSYTFGLSISSPLIVSKNLILFILILNIYLTLN